MIGLAENNSEIEHSSRAPVFTVAKIDSLFKRMMESIDVELGTDKAKIAQWESNIRKRFNILY